MCYKGCGLLCAHKKSFNTAIPVRSLGPYMYVHFCTCIVHILVWTYLFLLTSFFDRLSFCGLFLKHPYKRFFSFLYSLFLPIEISLAPWCDVCGGSSSLLTTELVAYYVTVLSHGLHGFIFLLYNYDYLYFILFSIQNFVVISEGFVLS